GVCGGVGSGAWLAGLVGVVCWRMTAFAVARVGFHLVRAATGSPARFTAAGDLVFSLVSLGVLGWLWAASPLTPLIGVETVADFIGLVQDMIHFGDVRVATVVMLGLAFAIVGEIFTALGALRRLIRGR